MKRMEGLSQIAGTIGAALLLFGCNSLSGPDLFASGRDARVYNPLTGRYEWPDDEAPAKHSKPRVSLSDSRPNEKPSNLNPNDTRVFNPITSRYEESRGN